MNKLAILIAALSVSACGGGSGSESSAPIVRPAWIAETDTLDTFEQRLRDAACPGPVLIDSTGHTGPRLARIELVARECAGSVL